MMALRVSLWFSPLSVILMAPLKKEARRHLKGPGHALLASLFPYHLFFSFLIKQFKRHTVYFLIA